MMISTPELMSSVESWIHLVRQVEFVATRKVACLRMFIPTMISLIPAVIRA